jgi:hypothetical protein
MPGYITATAHSLLDWYFRASSLSPPATTYMGLFSTMPDDAGASGVELSGTGYARKSLAAAVWTAAASRKVVNTADIEFTAAAGAAWGTAIGFGLFSASTSGTLLFKGTFPQGLPITLNLPVIFAATKVELILN